MLSYANLRCDQNESELVSIDFKIRANNSIQFPLYFIVLGITEIAISLEPNVQFSWGFQHDIALKW